MATRETQAKITNAALELFNEFGSASVSFEKIAGKAGISKGNLHYHFSSKEQIVMALWLKLDKIRQTKHPLSDFGLPNLSQLLMGYFQIIWNYRFIYSELNFLLAKDSELQYRFAKERKQRMDHFSLLLNTMKKEDLLVKDATNTELLRLVKTIWVVSDYWLGHIAAEGTEITYEVMAEGYELIAQLMKPYLKDPSSVRLPDNYCELARSSAELQLKAVAGGG